MNRINLRLNYTRPTRSGPSLIHPPESSTRRINDKPNTDELRTQPKTAPPFRELTVKGVAWADVFAKIEDSRRIKSWAFGSK